MDEHNCSISDGFLPIARSAGHGVLDEKVKGGCWEMPEKGKVLALERSNLYALEYIYNGQCDTLSRL